MALFKKILIIIIALIAFPTWALQSYHATYKISIRGVGVGKVRYEAIFTPRTYRINTIAEPSFAAKMLGFGRIQESVHGLLQDKEVVPQYYQRDMEGDADYYLIYDYDPQQRIVKVTSGNTPNTLHYEQTLRPLDVLSLVAQSLLDYENNVIAQNYTLLSDDKMRTYQVKEMDKEIWQEPNGQHLTVRVFRQINDDRQTWIYFADKPLRLLKLMQLRNGEVRFALKLINYQMK